MKTKRWKPKDGELYWYIDDFFTVALSSWDNYSYEVRKQKIGNCFKTKSEAIAAAKAVKKLLSEDS